MGQLYALIDIRIFEDHEQAAWAVLQRLEVRLGVGLSVEVYGRLWVRVTPRSAKRNATGWERASEDGPPSEPAADRIEVLERHPLRNALVFAEGRIGKVRSGDEDTSV